MANKPKTGDFFPKHGNKVLPESDKLVYKSSLEEIFMRWCDGNANVEKWAYEPKTHRIPYKFIDETQWPQRTVKQMKVYHPDFLIHHRNKAGQLEKWLVEIKPWSQSVEPKPPKQFKTEKAKATFLSKQLIYMKNKAKWETSERYCKDRNFKFVVMTEKVLKSKKKPEIKKK